MSFAEDPKKLSDAAARTGRRGFIQTIVGLMEHQFAAYGQPEVGIDGAIELRDPSTRAMTGRVVFVQSKAHRGGFDDETAAGFTFRVERRDLDTGCRSADRSCSLSRAPRTTRATGSTSRSTQGTGATRAPSGRLRQGEVRVHTGQQRGPLPHISHTRDAPRRGGAGAREGAARGPGAGRAARRCARGRQPGGLRPARGAWGYFVERSREAGCPPVHLADARARARALRELDDRQGAVDLPAPRRERVSSTTLRLSSTCTGNSGWRSARLRVRAALGPGGRQPARKRLSRCAASICTPRRRPPATSAMLLRRWLMLSCSTGAGTRRSASPTQWRCDVSDSAEAHAGIGRM